MPSFKRNSLKNTNQTIFLHSPKGGKKTPNSNHNTASVFPFTNNTPGTTQGVIESYVPVS